MGLATRLYASVVVILFHLLRFVIVIVPQHRRPFPHHVVLPRHLREHVRARPPYPSASVIGLSPPAIPFSLYSNVSSRKFPISFPNGFHRSRDFRRALDVVLIHGHLLIRIHQLRTLPLYLQMCGIRRRDPDHDHFRGGGLHGWPPRLRHRRHWRGVRQVIHRLPEVQRGWPGGGLRRSNATRDPRGTGYRSRRGARHAGRAAQARAQARSSDAVDQDLAASQLDLRFFVLLYKVFKEFAGGVGRVQDFRGVGHCAVVGHDSKGGGGEGGGG